MTDYNSDALNRYMNEQDHADRCWEDFNTAEERWEAAQAVTVNQFDGIVEMVIDGLGDSKDEDILIELLKLSRCGLIHDDLKRNLTEACEGTEWFEDWVDDEMRERFVHYLMEL